MIPSAIAKAIPSPPADETTMIKCLCLFKKKKKKEKCFFFFFCKPCWSESVVETEEAIVVLEVGPPEEVVGDAVVGDPLKKKKQRLKNKRIMGKIKNLNFCKLIKKEFSGIIKWFFQVFKSFVFLRNNKQNVFEQRKEKKNNELNQWINLTLIEKKLF